MLSEMRSSLKYTYESKDIYNYFIFSTIYGKRGKKKPLKNLSPI